MKQAGAIYVYNILAGTWFPVAIPLGGTLTSYSPGSTRIVGSGTSFSTKYGIADNNYWLINTSNNEAQLIVRVYDDSTLETSKPFATDLAGASCVIVENHKLRSLRAIFKTGDGTIRSAHQAPGTDAPCSVLIPFESGDVEGGMTPLFVAPAIGQSANIRIMI